MPCPRRPLVTATALGLTLPRALLGSCQPGDSTRQSNSTPRKQTPKYGALRGAESQFLLELRACFPGTNRGIPPGLVSGLKGIHAGQSMEGARYFSSARNAEFALQCIDVRSSGSGRDPKTHPNLLIRQAIGQERQDLLLAMRQLEHSDPRFPAADRVVDLGRTVRFPPRPVDLKGN